MKSNFVFFLGLFAALGISYAGIVLGSNAQLGSLAPYYDDNESNAFPEWFPGVAARGQLVYRDLGCAACHTQQVRRPGFGSDQARGWGERQSVARDYIYQPAPQLGLARIGPDLANIGGRKPTAPDADDLLNLLYSGSEGMPPYRFLFEMRKIGSEAQPSDQALKLVGVHEPKKGWEVVPTQRARDLVGYLVNLRTTYDYPEAVPFSPPKTKGEAPAPAAAPAKAAAPVPAGGAPAAKPAAAPAPAGSPAPAPGGAASPTPTGAAPAAAPTPSPAGPAPSPAGPPAPAPSGTPSPTPGTAASPTPTGAAPAGSPTPSPAPSPTGAPAPAPSGSPSPAPGGAISPTPAGAAPAAAPAPAAPATTPAAPSAAPTVTPTPTGTGGAK